MPSYPDVTAPPWIEADSFRETTIQNFDDPEHREALRQVGRMLYDMAVEASRELGGESSVTRAELRAVAADLRYASGYCAMVARAAVECSLDAKEERLARFAGKVGRRVGALVELIEERLS
ncbi:MAG TPA: hypothetical protein VJA16_11420 [Thermoanaerobaculia bacterium]